jgi:ribosomal-protein-alanine N-acetyltransferase
MSTSLQLSGETVSRMLPLKTERLVIRQFLAGDAEGLFDYLSLPSTYAYEPGTPISRADAQRLASERSGGLEFLAVELKTERTLIGHISIALIEPKDFMTYALGYIFNPCYHHHGYATEAARAVIGYCFKDLGAHRIVAYCNPQNAASWRVLERCGMTREAVLRKNVYFRKDAQNRPIWTDTYQYAILSSDHEVVG